MLKADWYELGIIIQGRWPEADVTDDWLDAWYPIVEHLSIGEAAVALDTYSRQGNQWAPNGGNLWAVARGAESEASALTAVELKSAAANGGRLLAPDHGLHDLARLLGGWARLGRMDEEEWRYIGPQIREALHTIARRDGAPLPARIADDGMEP